MRKYTPRRKIELKKIGNLSDLHVTFTKRRNGLFKKASELATLCNAEVAVIVRSPGGKYHSFGHPNTDVLLDRFYGRNPGPVPVQNPNPNIEILNQRLAQLMEEVKAEEAKRHQIRMHERCPPATELNLTQAVEMLSALQDLKRQIAEVTGTGTVHGGDNSNHGLVDQIRMIDLNSDPNPKPEV